MNQGVASLSRTTESLKGDRVEALELAVQHHGLAASNSNAAPASAQTVIRTAGLFLDWITEGTIPERHPEDEPRITPRQRR